MGDHKESQAKHAICRKKKQYLPKELFGSRTSQGLRTIPTLVTLSLVFLKALRRTKLDMAGV